jgi:hypothetical protein
VATGLRTTIYLTAPAAKVLEQVKAKVLNRYGAAPTVSSIVARLLLGETLEEVVTRPYRPELGRVAAERDSLRQDLRRAKAKRRAGDLHRIRRAIAALYPSVKQIVNSVGSVRTGHESHSPDFAEASRIEESLDAMMAECVDAMIPGRRR